MVTPESSPPSGVTGGRVPWIVPLDASPNISADLGNFEAFPSGVRLTLRAQFKPGVFDPLGTYPGAPGGPHIAVTFADGRAGKVKPPPPLGSVPRDPIPGDVIFDYCAGRGGTNEWTMVLWLSPLPPSGQLTFTIGWPEKGAPVSAVHVDAAELIRASHAG